MCCCGKLSEFHIVCQEECDVESGDISSVLSVGLLAFVLKHFNSAKGLYFLSLSCCLQGQLHHDYLHILVLLCIWYIPFRGRNTQSHKAK